jgi:hypothetical protein
LLEDRPAFGASCWLLLLVLHMDGCVYATTSSFYPLLPAVAVAAAASALSPPPPPLLLLLLLLLHAEDPLHSVVLSLVSILDRAAAAQHMQ